MILSIAPRIVFLENVLTDEQCNLITESTVEFSKLGIVKDQQHMVDESYRNNYSHKDTEGKFKFLQELAHKLLINYSPNKNLNAQPEPVQLQRYDTGQEYKPHLDFFNSSKTKVVKRDRVATVIFYLNDDFVGGQTYFPRIDINVTPIKGSALIFYYNKNIEQLSILTEHTGKPIINGTKYIATIWFDENE